MREQERDGFSCLALPVLAFHQPAETTLISSVATSATGFFLHSSLKGVGLFIAVLGHWWYQNSRCLEVCSGFLGTPCQLTLSHLQGSLVQLLSREQSHPFAHLSPRTDILLDYMHKCCFYLGLWCLLCFLFLWCERTDLIAYEPEEAAQWQRT